MTNEQKSDIIVVADIVNKQIIKKLVASLETALNSIQEGLYDGNKYSMRKDYLDEINILNQAKSIIE